MGKAAASKKTTTADDQVQQYMDALTAKRQFVTATANMGWRLAITVVIPIVAGVKIDEHFHSSPSYTLTGCILAAAAGSAAVWSTIKEVQKEQAEEEKMNKPKRRNRRA